MVLRGHLDTGGIVGVQHGEVFRALIFENAGLGVGVGGERAMPVEMVRSDVEHDGNSRAKGLNGLKLKAGDFEDGSGLGGCPFH